MPHTGTYILDGHEPVATELMAWSKWFEANVTKRHVADEMVGDVRVSTVFLGVDHQYMDGGPPLLFETMIFRDGVADDLMERCSTWDEALAQHAQVVERVQAEQL